MGDDSELEAHINAAVAACASRRRLCEHTSWFFGGDCANCKRNAELKRLADARNARNAHVKYPKTDDEHNGKLQQRLNKRRRLCEHTWLYGDCDNCKRNAELKRLADERNARNA